MKNIYLLSIFLSSLFAAVHRVPQDYSTIQAGFRSIQWDATDSMGRPVGADQEDGAVEVASL